MRIKSDRSGVEAATASSISTPVANPASAPGAWWSEEYGFFGPFYLEGDDSLEGYLESRRQTLQDRTAVEVDGIQRLLRATQPMAILDVPCGYGRHSVGLAEHGHDVVGVDINRTFLELARRRAASHNVRPRFVRDSMNALEFDSCFDAVINMFYSFGFFESDEENLDVLRRFHRALRKSGRFLLHTDVNLPRLLAGNYKFDEVRQLQSGRTLQIADRYDPVTKRINGHWKIGEDSDAREYSVRVYDAAEFVDMCRSVGFREVEVFSDWSMQPYHPASEEMMIVAHR